MKEAFTFGDINPTKYFYFIAISIGLLFALISPKTDFQFWLVIMQWQLQAIIPITLLIVSHVSLTKLRCFTKLNKWLQVSISGVIGSLLFVPFALLIDIYLMGEGWPAQLAIELVDEAGGVVPPVSIFWLLVNLPWLIGIEYRRKDQQTKNTTPYLENVSKTLKPASTSELLSLTHLNDYQDIVAMSAELHYLDVFTQESHKLILYSLKKAISEVPQNIGMQVHRSHWIAFKYIKKIVKKGRQGEAILTNGKSIPISRKNLKIVIDKVSDTHLIRE